MCACARHYAESQIINFSLHRQCWHQLRFVWTTSKHKIGRTWPVVKKETPAIKPTTPTGVGCCTEEPSPSCKIKIRNRVQHCASISWLQNTSKEASLGHTHCIPSIAQPHSKEGHTNEAAWCNVRWCQSKLECAKHAESHTSTENDITNGINN